MNTYIKLNGEPINIEYMEKEPDGDLIPAFIYQNGIYYLDDFVRTHNNPWIYDDFPENIHGMDSINHYNPIFIEIIDGEQVNVYEELYRKEGR